VDVLRVSHQPVYEGFLTWQAIQEGLDKKAGLELKMVYFDSGMPQVRLDGKTAGYRIDRTVPMLLAALRLDALMVATSYDDSFNHFVLVRPDSPIPKTMYANPKYPEVMQAEDIKGKPS
jgi:NitT/TauT family transport system substrate-binding protein/sulfonate transport system substrate-binding protein